jgi:hypothetical protein
LSLEDARAGVFIQEFKFDSGSSVPLKLGRALFRTLYGGPSCHRASGLPMKRLEESGCLVQASTSVGQEEVPIGKLSIESVRVVRVSAPYSSVATPITYMVDGKQYIVVGAGGSKLTHGAKGGIYFGFALP